MKMKIVIGVVAISVLMIGAPTIQAFKGGQHRVDRVFSALIMISVSLNTSKASLAPQII